jgi:preprotein translocase subunit YajC
MTYFDFALIAQSVAPSTAPSGAPQATPGGGQQSMVLLVGLMLAFVVVTVLTGRTRRKEQKERQRLIDNLGKNDRVMTIGGIIGTVVAVRENEVVLKVDEATNTKMTFMKKAIQQVLTDGQTPPVDKQT